jgi:hypothetical protein
MNKKGVGVRRSGRPIVVIRDNITQRRVSAMPSLVAGAYTLPENIPVIWVCSQCGLFFDFKRIIRNPSRAQVEELNGRFRAHCESDHRGMAPIIGLPMP